MEKWTLIAFCLFFFQAWIYCFKIVPLPHRLGKVFNIVSLILKKLSIAFPFIFLSIVNSDLFLDI